MNYAWLVVRFQETIVVVLNIWKIRNGFIKLNPGARTQEQ